MRRDPIMRRRLSWALLLVASLLVPYPLRADAEDARRGKAVGDSGTSSDSNGSAESTSNTPDDVPQRPTGVASSRKASRPTTAEIHQALEQLDAADFEVRQRATRTLVAAGAEGVGPLLESLEKGSLERAVRAVVVLERLYVSGRPEAVDAAEAALEQLAETGQPAVSRRCRQVLERHFDAIGQPRALSKLRELGAAVDYGSEPLQTPDGTTVIDNVRIGPGWSGGDEGLKYVRRLRSLRTLYLIDGAKISDRALADLQRALPQLTVQRRGRAYLGISGFLNAMGCQVGIVKPGTAAHRAGIRTDDIITRFDGKKITDFDTLVELIGRHQPGEKVPVEIIRQGTRLTVEVELGEWGK